MRDHPRPVMHIVDRRRGLTLLEVVVAMVVVSLLMGALYGSFRSAHIAERSGREAVHRMQGASEAVQLLRTDLLGALEPTGTLGGRWFADSQGDGLLHELAFRTNTGLAEVDYRGLTAADLDGGGSTRWPVQPVGSDVQEVRWSLEPDPDGSGRHVLRRAATRNVLATSEPHWREQVIVRGVRGVYVRYYDGQDWLDQWESDLEGNRLPLAVEMVIELDRAGRRTGGAQADRVAAGDGVGQRVTTVVYLPTSDIADEEGLRR